VWSRTLNRHLEVARCPVLSQPFLDQELIFLLAVYHDAGPNLRQGSGKWKEQTLAKADLGPIIRFEIFWPKKSVKKIGVLDSKQS
jgi:hypothetical protein